MADSAPLALPGDVVLLHIGPFKTGTTTLQGAFHTGRERLADHGVHYAGAGRQPMLAALAMTGRPGRKGDPKATKRHWQELVDDVVAARDKRVLVSSEFFADAPTDAARQVIENLGGPRVHVAVTLRPLYKIMPSQWQQYVQNGLRVRYEDWLDHMLNQPPYEKPTPTFWNRHSHDRLVERWAEVVGPDRLTVIVLDESNRRMLLDTFEALLGLPIGLLEPDRSIANRSLTLGEVEVVRQLNEEFKRRKWPDSLYGRFARTGVAKKMLQREPLPGEPGITTPRWALEKAAEIGAAMAVRIEASGVRVVGDLDTLGRLPAAPADPDAASLPEPAVPSRAAAIAIVGTIAASRNAVWPPKKGQPAAVPTSPIHDGVLDVFSSKELIQTVAARARRRVFGPRD